MPEGIAALEKTAPQGGTPDGEPSFRESENAPGLAPSDFGRVHGRCVRRLDELAEAVVVRIAVAGAKDAGGVEASVRLDTSGARLTSLAT